MADYPGEFNFGGLGYNNSIHDPTTDGNFTNADDAHQRQPEAAPSAAGDMLKQLMQQCLAYHEKQQQEKVPEPPPREYPPPQAYQSSPFLLDPSHDNAYSPTSNDGFQNHSQGVGEEYHPASIVPQPMESHIQKNNGSNQELVSSSSPLSTHQKHDIEKFVQEGRSRANAILEKFQQLTRDHGVTQPPPLQASSSSGLLVPSASATDWESQAASEYRIKRERFLESEKKRKNKFLIKNWEYVSRRNDRKLQQQLHQLEQAKEWEDQVQDQYRKVLELRKERLLGGNKHNKNNTNTNKLSSQAGIGTSKRKRVEQEKHREGHTPLASGQDKSAALYLSGMPTDGSVSEALLHKLFSGYGTIRKIHVYKNKKTGAFKGDALIVYEVQKLEEIGPLLQSVCSQVSVSQTHIEFTYFHVACLIQWVGNSMRIYLCSWHTPNISIALMDLCCR